MTTTAVPTDRFPSALLELLRTLSGAGHGAWVVGGSLRDLLLGRPVSDFDVATSARPEQVLRLFKRTIPTGIKHGTVTVMLRGTGFEVTTLRGEGAYSDGRHPDSIDFVDDIAADLARRDFTVNALAYDPLDGELVDPFGGRADLEEGLLRAVGDPMQRFGEDGLRILRGARFTASLGFALEPATEAAFRPSLEVYRKVSKERVREEWMKTMKAAAPSRAFAVMKRTGILEVSCPLLDRLEQSRFETNLAVLDALEEDPLLRHAALFLTLPASHVETWLATYRYSNEEQRTISHLVACAPSAVPGLSEAELRRVLKRVTRAHASRFFALLEARGTVEALDFVSVFVEEARAALDAGLALTTSELAIRGQDLLALGRPPGRWVGAVLDALLERVLDDPSRNTRETLLQLARAMLEDQT